MRRLSWAMMSLVGVPAIALALAPAPAQSAADSTPPLLKTPVKASFTVGYQIPLGVVPDCGNGEPWDLRMYAAADFKWTGSDASGPVHYDLLQSNGVNGTDYVQLPGDNVYFIDRPDTSYAAGFGMNNNQDCGGGNSTIWQWDLIARDAAGNETTHQIYGGRIRLTQDNNLGDLANYAVQPSINYTGSWGLASCTCWSQGGVHKSTAKNAAATLTLNFPFSQFGDPANPAKDWFTHVALVMHKGPGRGKFKVYVNGVLNATVDTYAAADQPRTVVWQVAVDGTGTGLATIEVVNQATKGRPRIDLDAVLTN